MNSFRTEEEQIDPEEINEKMASFAQDILELGALKNNIPLFKNVRIIFYLDGFNHWFMSVQRIEVFVEKRTSVMVMLKKVATSMDPNDAKTYKVIFFNIFQNDQNPHFYHSLIILLSFHSVIACRRQQKTAKIT